MAGRTYSDVIRDAAKLYDIAASHILVADDPSDKEAAELANAVLGSLHREQAAHLRSLAALLDTAGTACVGTKEADEAMERLFAPLSDS